MVKVLKNKRVTSHLGSVCFLADGPGMETVMKENPQDIPESVNAEEQQEEHLGSE